MEYRGTMFLLISKTINNKVKKGGNFQRIGKKVKIQTKSKGFNVMNAKDLDTSKLNVQFS